MPAAAAEKEQPATRFAKDQLKAFVEVTERLEEEKKATSDDIRDVYAEAKGTGFDIKALRSIVRLRKLEPTSAASSRRCSTLTCTRSAWRTRADLPEFDTLVMAGLVPAIHVFCSQTPRRGCPRHRRAKARRPSNGG